MKAFFVTLGIILLIAYAGVRGAYELNFKSHSKNPQELAAFLEKQNLTTGYTSIFWETEDENLATYYETVKNSKDLAHIERPVGIAIYPHNGLFALWLAAALICLLPIISEGPELFCILEIFD